MQQLEWQHLFGKTQSFGLRIGLCSPRTAALYGFPEDTVDFGTFEIYVDGRCLTANYHATESRTFNCVCWKLTEILSWLIRSWNPLLAELEFPHRSPRASSAVDWLRSTLLPGMELTQTEEAEWYNLRHAWWSRHSLRAIEGVALPNVAFRRLWNFLEVSWNNEVPSLRRDIGWLEQSGRSLQEPRHVGTTLKDAALSTLRQIAAWLRCSASPTAEVGCGLAPCHATIWRRIRSRHFSAPCSAATAAKPRGGSAMDACRQARSNCRTGSPTWVVWPSPPAASYGV